MRIGELSKSTGVDIETIRFYEKSGLLPPPARSENGYRDYAHAHLERLAFIRHCRALDMSLAAASKHIQMLERAGLLRRTKRGRTHYCRLEARPLSRAHDWISFYERFWNLRLDALERELRKDDKS